MTIIMIECLRCGNCFRSDAKGMSACSSCCEEDPVLANLVRLAAVYKPPSKKEEIPLQGVDAGWSLTPEEEAWFHKKPEDYSH